MDKPESGQKLVTVDPVATLERTISLIGKRIEAKSNRIVAVNNRRKVTEKFTEELSKVNLSALIAENEENPSKKNAELVKTERARRKEIADRRNQDESYKTASKTARVARQIHELAEAEEDAFFNAGLKGLKFGSS